MDNTELHYLSYDPEALWRAMYEAYVNAGGDPLWPGDEKEMLLRGAQAILVQGFAGVDNALRMQTLRYAVGEYLDVYGENRGCIRIFATKAKSLVTFTFKATGVTYTLPAGTVLTVDGTVNYLTDEAVTHDGTATTAEVGVTCAVEGIAGNALTAGTVMQMVIPQGCVTGVVCSANASGGNNRENDETYRERIRVYGLRSVTTGTTASYEAAAKAVSTEIIDVKAINLGGGSVGVYLILEGSTAAETVIAAVTDALNAKSARPLSDTVTVAEAEAVPYTLNVTYVPGDYSGSNITEDIAAATAEYKAWQDNVIGRAFNPDKLTALLYQAGAARVTVLDSSHFGEDGEIEYTTIDPDQRCLGTISVTEAVENG